MTREKVDKYTKYARILPSIVSMILPCISVIWCIYNISAVREFFDGISKIWEVIILIIPCSVFYISLGYSARELFRSISKLLFQYTLFREDETKMPSTDLLIFENSAFSDVYINKIMTKIKNDFGIKLKNRNQQKLNIQESRKEIANAVQLIRNITRDDKILFQYNIEFGFCRNFMGGSVVAILLSIILVIISVILDNGIMFLVIVGLIEVLFLLIAFAFLKYRGRSYARQLYAAYLTKK